MSAKECEVLVIGGGPAGAGVAIRLQRSGLRVCLASISPGAWSCRETLSPAAVHELSSIGIGDHSLERLGVRCFGIEAIWGSRKPSFHSHLLEPPAAHGWHIDKTALQSLLLDTARENGVDIIVPGHCRSLTRIDGQWQVRLEASNRVCVNSQVLVDASGRPAAVAKSLGAVRRRVDSLCCAGSTVSASSAKFSRVLSVQAAPYGWWYSAPVSEDSMFIGLVSDSDILRALRASAVSEWSVLFSRTSFARDMPSTAIKLRFYPCETAWLEPISGLGWLAVGDAAVTFDPLSSLGVPQALTSARHASSSIIAFLSGSAAALNEYAKTQLDLVRDYLRSRQQHYAIESRWTSELFWKRRRLSASSDIPRA